MAKIATKAVSEAGVTWTFTNGRVVSVDVTTLSAAMQLRLAVHGMSAKGGDSYASAGDKGMTLADCADGVEDIIANLRNEIWSASGGSGISILAEALARVVGESVEAAVLIINEKGDEWKKGLAKRDDIKSAVADIRAERAKAKLAGQSGGSVDDLKELF